ncbi:NADPH-dependent 2,4-dienoyl-CoA reductase/sulfur reductase-like enzyme/rhodanese-related sulfurtransferase [Clostridium tetanomorphum]|uniref:FAD-dependent oxidoreductase n=1 Tax=Clostridium tetanomorphum TaxID=1553 RepID=A0A923E8K5_CLOTT|nr:FAD-dependent oxidoreductase [Clostridium tetanomorphum]KAJ53726.1 NAD(FAD)-dependent dehydrogenase [Clostridium tetanomorphum DSM 665]MBC2397237.1 FAD-dependent oxidoreductase [Clostridium tetanomorphum]MBP1862454.1 NADPH-dependent 2,4-dienoyl-CoA reductase/sulfur reductase-like enzyme/rhodanese-related sulfurtransferase [Clostridium tetanomorphum]NRS85706.1 NADPH-dependent 2,4-dienoyl-CoA reductase/sulfur reductase-like enzyme/rhodanese-related sulfurtransferase [Clostridium tetanomorphum]
MRILVIGAVAAGTSAAAKARRNDDTAEIVIYEKDKDISYSGCGLPYYIGGGIEDIGELAPRDSLFFKNKYNIDIFTGFQVLNINPELKGLKVKNLYTDEIFEDKYDKLIIATGAIPFVPNVKGIDNNNVFFLRNVESAKNIRNFIEERKPQYAVIAGTGFIGFEMLENLMTDGIKVTIIEKQNKITPNLDEDMAAFLENELIKKNMNIIKNSSIIEINQSNVILEDGRKVKSDMVIMATGIKPNVTLAKKAGVEIGVTGAIKVSTKMETSIKDIYACGDCIETFSIVTGKPVYRPLGSTANKTGRIAGDVVTGGNLEYKGNLGTGIFKLFNMTIANTGLTEMEAIKEGYEIAICHNIKPDKPSYFQGKEMVIKAVADRKTEKLLGVQIVGYDGVDKRIDIFATLITYGAKVNELFHLDLAYAPPFSTTKDPVHYTGMILDNALNKNRLTITAKDTENLIKNEEKIQIIDARDSKQYTESHVDSAINIPHSHLREKLKELDKNITTITYCNKGVTGNAAQNILINHGFKKVYNLSGGHKFYKSIKKI